MHDDNGRSIPGFYDGVKELPPDIKAERLDLTPENFLAEVGPRCWPGKGPSADRADRHPTAEINGMIGGYTGEGAKTVIPGQATAKVSSAWSARRIPRRSAMRSTLVRAASADAKVESVARRRAGNRAPVRQSGARRPAPRSLPNGARRRSRSGRAVDPHRRRLQARARHGYDHGRLRARRRPRIRRTKHDLTSFLKERAAGRGFGGAGRVI